MSTRFTNNRWAGGPTGHKEHTFNRWTYIQDIGNIHSSVIILLVCTDSNAIVLPRSFLTRGKWGVTNCLTTNHWTGLESWEELVKEDMATWLAWQSQHYWLGLWQRGQQVECWGHLWLGFETISFQGHQVQVRPILLATARPCSHHVADHKYVGTLFHRRCVT